MRWSFAAAGMFMMGIIGVVVIILFQKITTINENDYYLLKEITESAMIDAINYELYEQTGRITIVREKFVESFTRRYAESTLFIGTNYIISFYDIIEEPPKVSLFINTGIQDYKIFNEKTTSDYNVNNYLTAILEVPGKYNSEDGYVEKTYRTTYYSLPNISGSGGKVEVTQPINIPEQLKYENIKDVEINDIYDFHLISPNNPNIDFIGEVLMAKLKRDLDWSKASSGESTQDYTTVINPEVYANNLNTASQPVEIYDCQNPSGEKPTEVVCGGDYNNYWIHWIGTYTGNYSEMVTKFNIEWKYKEYELS